MFDSREFEWADVSVVLAGRDVVGLRGIKYSEKKEKEALYGKGSKPISIQSGNISYEGEVGLTESEYETLRLAMGGSILHKSISLVVAYGNPSQGDVMKTDILVGVQFTEDSVDRKQGDKFMEKSLPILFLDKKTA